MTRKASTSSVVTIRLPTRLLHTIETRAAAAQTTRSAYIVSHLADNEQDSSPSLAVLAGLISIHALVQENKTVSADQLRELSRLIDRLSLVIHQEFAR